MNPKLQQFLNKVGWVKWALPTALGLVVLSFVSLGLYLVTHPPLAYKDKIAQAIREALQAEKTVVRDVRWTFSFGDLSFGVKALDVDVEGSPRAKALSFKSFVISTQPLKLLFGKMPIKVVAHADKLLLSLPTEKAEAPTANSPLPTWIKYLRLDLEVKADEVSLDAAGLQSFGADSKLSLGEMNVRGTLAGVPGYFNLKFESEVFADLKNSDLSARGPLKSEIEGFFQVEANEPVGVRVSRFDVDLDEMTITGMGFVEKPSTIPLSLSSEVQVFFDKNLAVRTTDISKARLHYDNLNFDLNGSLENNGKVSVRWSVGKTEFKDLHLPFTSLRSVPLEGILETSGQMQYSPQDKLNGFWRMAFNNIKFNSSGLMTGDAASKGRVNLSFMSEGAIEVGRFSSPKTELQVNGTDAEINFLSGKFRKPIGRTFQLVAKAEIKDDNFSLNNFAMTFHQMEVQGSAHLNDISGFLSGAPAEFKMNLGSNRIDVSQYSTFLPLFRKPPPLEGFLEFSGGAEGILKRDHLSSDDIRWRVDRMNLSNFKTVFDKETLIQFGLDGGDFSLTGPMQCSFLFQGRGKGTVVDQASLMSQMDLTRSSLIYQNRFRKPSGIPLVFDVYADQSRQMLRIRRGLLSLHDLNLSFDGQISQGSSRGFVDLKMSKPLKLSNWRSLILDAEDVPFDGLVQWHGRLGFTSPTTMESNFDWQTLSVEGDLNVSDFTGRVNDFRNIVRKGQAKISVLPESINVSSLSFELGGAKVGATGKLDFGRGRKQGNIARLLSREGWELESAITMSRINPDDFASLASARKLPENMKPESLPLGPQIRALLDQPVVKGTKLQIALRSPEVTLKDFRLTGLNARLGWNKGLLQLQPAGFRGFGGGISGSLVWNAEKYYTRKDAPEFSASLKADTLDLTELSKSFKPDFASLVGGKFDGQLTLASNGYEMSEWMDHLRGRMNGRVTAASFETLQVLNKMIDGLTSQSAVKDLLLREAKREACIQKKFSGETDIEIIDGRLAIDKANLNFDAGSSVELKGQVKKDLSVELDGNFLAGAKCISGDARACLADAQGRAAIPFEIRGPAASPSVKAEYAAIATKVAACAGQRLAKRAEAAVKKQVSGAVKQGTDAIENRAKDALKSIFKDK
ncbi:MAG: hypothetical protein JST16_03300 [Bdellovibrionales bacterium]|nr:hypothetical protein [Bdellovibrionales bacterium]